MRKKTERTPTITFQPTEEVKKLIAIGKTKTGKNQTVLINEAIHRKLPEIIRELEREYLDAKNLLESHSAEGVARKILATEISAVAGDKRPKGN